MKILVGFKLIPDFDMFSENDWMVSSHFQVDTSYIKRIFNPYDESGLEIALRIRDKMHESLKECQLTAFTIDDGRADMTLKNLRALKYNRAIKIENKGDTRFSPEIIAEAYRAYARKDPQDLYILGSQAAEGDNGQTPYLLAEFLGIPCISGVSEIEYDMKNNLVNTTSLINGMELKVSISPPAVLVIGNSKVSYLRVPTLKDRMVVGKLPAESIPLEELIDIEKISGELSLEPVELWREIGTREGKLCTRDDINQVFEKHIKELIE